jgi:hypothetical protein
VKLRNLLRKQLAGWQKDLSVSWLAAVEGRELDFDHKMFDREVYRSEIMIPGRKGSPVPESPPGAHVFHAFEALILETFRR